MRQTLEYSEDSTQPVSANSSVSEGPASPAVVNEATSTVVSTPDANLLADMESLKRLLQEVRVYCYRLCFHLLTIFSFFRIFRVRSKTHKTTKRSAI